MLYLVSIKLSLSILSYRSSLTKSFRVGWEGVVPVMQAVNIGELIHIDPWMVLCINAVQKRAYFMGYKVLEGA